VHAFRGKEFVEYDNRFDVGMTGLIGFSSGYRAMEHCDALLLLGTDFPYRQFFPDGVPVIQVDVRGEQIGRRVPVDVPLVGTVAETTNALLPLITAKTDSAHLDRMTAHYRRARGALRAAFGHDGPALVDVATTRHELSLPPKLTYGEIKGFTLYATRTILSGAGDELVELAKTNLRDLDIE
jgi:pyruvate dehydrogenase (quinone)